MPDDTAALAAELQGIDPFALMAGAWAPAALALVPFSPAMAEARTRFLADGGGPLAEIPQAFIQQGLPADQAGERARLMLDAAQGMAVLVVANDQGVAAIPQFWFGHVDPLWIDAFIQSCGPAAGDGAQVRAWFQELEGIARGGRGWPHLISGGDARERWLDLAHAVADAGPGAPLADLAHWCAAALLGFPGRIEPDDAAALARCHLLAGEADHGLRLLTVLADADPEIAVEVAQAAADAAIAAGVPAATEDALARLAPAIEVRIGRCYELRLLLVRLRAAAGDPRVVEAARDLAAADRKHARQDLGREPIWRVTVADPGPLLDTAAAADRLGRSPQFVGKRLDNGTIPHHRAGDRLRLPEAALQAWKTIVEEHGLIG
ncbi:MAG: hypothetical protein RLZZ127_1149 [Planctomycetota bacterium]|jgi:excisionase family DNA binding protein